MPAHQTVIAPRPQSRCLSCPESHLKDWFKWITREAKRLRWSFLAHWHCRRIKACRGDRERMKPHFRALITANHNMDAVMRVNPNLPG